MSTLFAAPSTNEGVYPLVKITINLPQCDMETLPTFTAYLQQCLPILNSVSNLVEVAVSVCCMGCEAKAATAGRQDDMIETSQQKDTVYLVNVPADEYQYEDDEDCDAIQEHGIDPYDLPELTDPGYSRVENNCTNENMFYCSIK